MRKTRILYVITSLGLGGAENLLLSYLRKLDNTKYIFHVCCLREKPDDLYNEITNYALVTNLNVKNKFNPVIIFHLIKLIRSYKPDIIHTHLFQPRIYTTFANLFYHGAILITHKHNRVNPIKHNIFIFLEMLSSLFNKKIIAISESVKESLQKYEFIPEKKIIVIPNAIEYQIFSNTVKIKDVNEKKKLIIGTIGRLEKQKGIEYLILAMKQILTRFPEARLEIIGDGSQAEKLKNLCKKLGISNSVFFFGKFADVIPFYRRMDVFVLSSIYEGFGIVLLEAMASAVPVVASNVGGVKEVINDMSSGLLVPSKNPNAIASAVIRILEDPRLAKCLSDEGMNRAKLFDIRIHINKLDTLYTNLLGEESFR